MTTMLMFQIILQSICLCNRLEKNVHSPLTIPNIQYKYFGNSMLLRPQQGKPSRTWLLVTVGAIKV